jgi:AcrR family transcriptional regulator
VIHRIHTYNCRIKMAPPIAAHIRTALLGARLEVPRSATFAADSVTAGLLSDRSLTTPLLDPRVSTRLTPKDTSEYLIVQRVSQILWQTFWMVERWTRERRLEHTRSLLLDAAEDVFAEKGFAPATLDDIAQTAGYTKGAIYKHFATKADLFLAVSDRYWRRYFDNFADVMSSAEQIGSRELDQIAARWRQLSSDRGAEHAALGHEFSLYLLRNPDVRERVAEKRSEVVEALAQFIVEGIDRLGGTLLIPPVTFAQVLVATSDSVVLSSELDGVDLFRPIIEMYMSAIKLP